MMRSIAAGLALLCGMAGAVPTNSLNTLSWAQTVQVDGAFAQTASVEVALAQLLSDATGAPHITATIGSEAHRRLQTGTTLTINYAISCGSNCDALTARLNNIASDPAAGLAHATAIIAAINQASVAAGFGQAVLSAPADVVATIQAPTSVSITLPPAPAPGCKLPLPRHLPLDSLPPRYVHGQKNILARTASL